MSVFVQGVLEKNMKTEAKIIFESTNICSHLEPEIYIHNKDKSKQKYSICTC